MLAIVEAPLLGAEGEALKRLPHTMPDEYETWVDAQLFSAKASQQYANYKDIIFPLERTQTKQTLDTMWRYVNLVRGVTPPHEPLLTNPLRRTTKPCLASRSTPYGIWERNLENKHHSSTVTIFLGRMKNPKKFQVLSLPGPYDKCPWKPRWKTNQMTRCPIFNQCPTLQMTIVSRVVNGGVGMTIGTRMIGTLKMMRG